MKTFEFDSLLSMKKITFDLFSSFEWLPFLVQTYSMFDPPTAVMFVGSEKYKTKVLICYCTWYQNSNILIASTLWMRNIF